MPLPIPFWRRDPEVRAMFSELEQIRIDYIKLMMKRPPIEALSYLLLSPLEGIDEVALHFSTKARISRELKRYRELYEKLKRA